MVSALEDRERGLILGAEDYITKPVDEKTLINSIVQVLERNAPGEKPAILIIDSDEKSLIEISGALRDRRYDVIVHHISDDMESLAKKINRTPDLILVDMEVAGNRNLCGLMNDEKLKRLFSDARILFIIKEKGRSDYAEEDTHSG